MTRWLAAAALVASLGVRLAAHPVATTTVTVDAGRSGHVVVALVADADALIAKLEALSSRPLSAYAPVAPQDRAARLDALASEVTAGLAIEFDGTRVTPSMQPAEVSDAGQATIRLALDQQPGAQAMTWASSLIFGSYPVAFRLADGTESLVWLQGPERSQPMRLGGGSDTHTIARAVWLGFTHILPRGLDHILFVIGLFLLGGWSRQLLAQVTAFTLAHSITLGLSLYGVFSLPSHIVEPLIALSVAYVGIENLMTTRLQPWRVVVVFCFGLLHGVGFAEALASLHLARTDMLTTLVSFNVGVEAGQLAVIVLAASVLYAATRLRVDWRPRLVASASSAIGLTGLFWTLQRML